MKALQIELNDAKSIKNFVTIVQKYPFEIGLRAGGYRVDAKSILGIFSLAPAPIFNVEIYASDCGNLINELREFLPKR